MKVILDEVCERESSNLKQSDVINNNGDYPIYGAAGYIGNVDFYHQGNPYIAVVKDGAGIGRATLLPAYSSVIGTMQYLIPKSNVLPEYLYYVIRNMHLEKYYTGATIPHIYFKDYKKETFNLSSIEEQRKIVDILGKVERIIEARTLEMEQFNILIRARFVEMFENKGYPVCKLSEYTTKITDGTHKTPNYLSEGVVFISAKNIVNGKLNFSDVKHISKEEYDEIQKRCELKKGDILLSKSGSLGAPVVVETDECLGLFESLAVLKGKWNLINNIFLCEQLKTQEIQRQFKAAEKGIAVKHLHLGVIANTNIIVSPIDLQNQFADFVHQVDKSKAAIQKSLDETQLLFDSLMQKYFG